MTDLTITENHDALVAKLGSNGFDLGHVVSRLNSAGWSGLGAVAVPCSRFSKGQGGAWEEKPRARERKRAYQVPRSTRRFASGRGADALGAAGDILPARGAELLAAPDRTEDCFLRASPSKQELFSSEGRIMSNSKTAYWLFCLLILVASSGCGSDPTSPGVPGVEPEVINEPDAFQFQVTAVDGYTGVLTYPWTNTGAMANVDQSCAVESGQATVVLVDSEGNEVYTEDLSVDGSYTSTEGVAGDWQVRVELSAMVGNLNFRAEKATP